MSEQNGMQIHVNSNESAGTQAEASSAKQTHDRAACVVPQAHATAVIDAEREASSAKQTHVRPDQSHEHVMDGVLKPVHHMTKKDLIQLLNLQNADDETLVAVTRDIFPLEQIPQLVKNAMSYANIREREDACRLLHDFSDYAIYHGGFRHAHRIVCKSFLELPAASSHEALPLMIHSGLLRLFIYQCKPHHAEMLDWVSRMAVNGQKQFWLYLSHEFCDGDLLPLFKHGEWKQLFAMIEVIQPELATYESFNDFVAVFCVELSNVCENTAKLLLRQYAGDLAAHMLDWLLQTDQNKFLIFDGSFSDFELHTHSTLPDIQLDSEELIEIWYKHTVAKKIDNVPWSVQKIMKSLFLFADDQKHSKFLFDWLKSLDINHRETGNLIQWKPGCAWVIAELLKKVIQQKRGRYCGLNKRKYDGDAWHDDCNDSEDEYCKKFCGRAEAKASKRGC